MTPRSMPTPDERAQLLAYYERILATTTSKDRQRRALAAIRKLQRDDEGEAPR